MKTLSRLYPFLLAGLVNTLGWLLVIAGSVLIGAAFAWYF